MKKVNTVFYIIGTVCILIALYIVFDKYIAKDNINFNEDEEMALVNDRLSEVGSSLGWIIIVDGINNQDANGNYNITFNENLFDNYGYKQLFVMEYILSNTINYDKFFVFDTNGKVIDDMPTSDFTLAYIGYDDFNHYYSLLFGEDYDNDKGTKGNTSYDDTHVYYDNRRAGLNGVYVSMIQTDSVQYKDGEYIGHVTITYSTRASELIGIKEDKGIIKYSKDIDENILFKSFILEDR